MTEKTNALFELQLGTVHAEVVRKPGRGPKSVQASFHRLFGDPENPKRARTFTSCELEDLEACLEAVRSWFETDAVDEAQAEDEVLKEAA